jgi:sugar-specific transcriptional regulator TrmB
MPLQNLKIQQTLTLLGLSQTETLVYLQLLETGSTPASVLARRAGLNRSTTRYTLENLSKKRLIFQSKKNGTFYFTPEDPKKILLLLQSEQQALKEKEVAASHILGDLQNLMNPHIDLPKVQFFEGVSGLIEMYEDVLLEAPENIYGYSRMNPQNIHPKIWEYVNKEYIPRRTEAGNKAFMIYNKEEINSDYLQHDSAMNRTSLFVPTEEFSPRSCFHIYGEKIAFYSRQKNESLNGILIKHPRICHDQLALFRLAWNYARTLEENKSHRNIKI